MYKKGDFVVYGNNGVCIVDSVGTIESTGIPKDKIYYTLIPYYSKGSKIFTPVDNHRVSMRPVLSREEAIKLIDDIQNIDALSISDDKRSELEYKEAYQKYNCHDLVKIIKAAYLRKQLRIEDGKKVASGDEKYFLMAEDRLYGELAISLKMDQDEVKNFIVARMEQATTWE